MGHRPTLLGCEQKGEMTKVVEPIDGNYSAKIVACIVYTKQNLTLGPIPACGVVPQLRTT